MNKSSRPRVTRPAVRRLIESVQGFVMVEWLGGSLVVDTDFLRDGFADRLAAIVAILTDAGYTIEPVGDVGSQIFVS